MKKVLAKSLASIYQGFIWLWWMSYWKFPSRVKRIPARVISIGNITWGGTGKTPLVIRLARDLMDTGKKVAVLTRGYGHDEIQELRESLPGVPVVVHRDRAKAAALAVRSFGSEILLLDDGFQHLRLHRDLDIVAINATLPFGPGGLIPLGTLREPLEHLSRAHAFILTKSNLGSKNLHWIRQKLLSIKPHAPIYEAFYKAVDLKDLIRNESVPFVRIAGKELAVISGIEDPFSFEKTVEHLGAKIVFAARFNDHHAYTAGEIAHFINRCRKIGVGCVVTTQKDVYRLKPLLEQKDVLKQNPDFRFLVLRVEVTIDDEENLLRRCLNP
ncbi:MAG: tetraacyldisaccharide 4'-kinase [Candidatus Omnitrophica bacterium]|nr:tetraacyldisaccharide 4'-kinase [Candidatus Omnitrophota bacterium]